MEDKKKLLVEYVKAIFTALVLALVIRAFIIQAFTIPSGSMIPTLLVGDYILVNKFLLGSPIDVPFTNINLFRMPGFREPRRGDVIVFKFPVDPSKDFIKRVIAVGGDTIEGINKVIYVNGVPLNEPYIRHVDNFVLPNRDNFGPIEVPKHKFFCMGDNRDNSRDSREWGFVDISDVKGKAWIIYFSKDISYPAWRLDEVRYDRIGRLIR
ncbi:MAG TPA: signal peptidase I [Thermodesulfovibrionales bacterium]|nr:signal peptidase I [Thermodesulfovibrionales bacterium]